MKKIMLAAILSMASASAFAGDSGFYSGTSLGHASVGNPTRFSLKKSSDNVLGGFIGFRLNDHFGVEGAYTGLGRFSNATQSGKSDALSLSAVGFVPLSDKFELFGKLGAGYSLGKSSKGGLSNENKLAPTYGVGIQYNVNSSIGLRFGIDRYTAAVKDASTVQNYNSNVIAATFVYKF